MLWYLDLVPIKLSSLAVLKSVRYNIRLHMLIKAVKSSGSHGLIKNKDLMRLLLHHSINIHDMTEKLELDKHLNQHYSPLLQKWISHYQSTDLNYFRMRNTETGEYRLLKCAPAYCSERNHSSKIQCISFNFINETKVFRDRTRLPSRPSVKTRSKVSQKYTKNRHRDKYGCCSLRHFLN